MILPAMTELLITKNLWVVDDIAISSIGYKRISVLRSDLLTPAKQR
jgi:hypothetical protein